MAVLAACASTDFTTATTWALVDATSYLAAETGSEILTTAYSGTLSSAFTPGAITVDGIGLKLSVRTGTTGTISVHLELATVEVTGTAVTINCSDLPAATTAGLDGGWVFFKFAAPVLLLAATAYKVAALTSSATQVSLFRDGTADNISRYLRTTTTQAPAAGDDLIITKEWTAAATGTALTVTMDQTAATDYGSAPTAANGLLTPGIAISQGGTLKWKDTSAANPLLRLSNSLIVYSGGVLNIGTVATPIPRDSVAVLEFDLTVDGDYGLLCRNGSSVTLQGLSRTSGKNIVSCKLNTDEAVNSTSLGVDTDTGWLDNDQIAVASTTRTAAQSELGALNGAAGASSLTVDGFAGAGGGLAFAHDGVSPVQAEVINITRNVKVRSTSATIMAYVFNDTTAIVDIDWAEFYYIGENAANKRGIEVATTTGSFNMQYSSIHDCEDIGLYLTGAVLNNVTFSNNVTWSLASVAGPGCQIATATTGTAITIDNNISIKTTAGNIWTLGDVGGTFTNNIAVGGAATGFAISEPAAIGGTFSNLVAHSNAGAGMTSLGLNNTTVTNFAAWRNNNTGLDFASMIEVTFESPVLFGNATQNIRLNTGGGAIILNSPNVAGDSSFSTTNGIALNNPCNGRIIIKDGSFGVVSGIKVAHTQADIGGSSAPVACKIDLNNTLLASSNEILNSTLTGPLVDNDSYISSQKHDQTAGNHKSFLKNGTVQTDATIFNTLAPSMRMTPLSASSKLESASKGRGLQIPVASGQTVAVSTYIRKSVGGDGAAYNGNQPRLIQRANPAIGIAANIVLATYSAAAGSWNQISGTTTAGNDDGVVEIVVDCDGTAGWINVEDFALGANVATMKYWMNGLPAVDPAVAASGVQGSRIRLGM